MSWTYADVARLRSSSIMLIALVAVTALACGSARAQYTTEHPDIRAAVDKGVEYLQANALTNESRAGGRALAGMAIYKATGNADDPTVLECIKTTREAYKELSSKEDYPDEGMYNAGLCTLFLISTDSVRYRREIDGWLRLLASRQKPNGGWGYWGRESGDTSMTQYGVLSCWEAHNKGIPVAPNMANGALSWLLRTQDPSGAFGYQGKLAPSLNQPVPQLEIRQTMATAGLGSLYVMADLFGAYGGKKDDSGLPPALKPVGEAQEGVDEGGHMKASVARDIIQRATQRGDAWFAANYKIEVRQWQHYYLYALERYQALKALAHNTDDPSPQWYNDGAKFLLKKQDASGYWSGDGGNTVDTSFAILFLIRSTRKSGLDAQNFGAGVMLGGRGIPKDTDQLTLRNGKVVSLEEIRLTQKMIDAVGDPESIQNAEMLDAISKLPPKESRLLATKHAEKLRGLLKSDSPQAKIAVAKTLGPSGDLSNAPTLILLLAEENKEVVLAARDALRRLSRRFDGFGLPDEYNDIERDKAIKAWKAWYRRFEPDVEFE